VRFVNHFLDGLQENRVRFFRLFSYFWWWSVVCKRFHCIFYNQTNFLTSNWQKLTSGRAMGQNAVRPDRKEPHKRYDVRDGSSCEKVNISDIQTCWVCRAELLPFSSQLAWVVASLSNDGRKKWKVWPENPRKAFLLRGPTTLTS